MKQQSKLVFLFLFFFIFSVTTSTIYSLYYRVIGNGNFEVQFATISTSGNGTVSISNSYLAHVYASYTGLPNAYDPINSQIYWTYPTNYGFNLYQINCRSQSLSQISSSIRNTTLDLQYDIQSKTLYGVTSNGSQSNSGVNFISFNSANISETTVLFEIPEVNAQYVGKGAIDEGLQYYYLITPTTLYTIGLSKNALIATVPIDRNSCGTLIAIYAFKEVPGILVGVATKSQTGYGDIGIVILNPGQGDCEIMFPPIGGSAGYFDSTADQVNNEISVLTNAGLYVINLSKGSYVLQTAVVRNNPEYFTALSTA